jgi:hypothetical protein
MNGAVTISVVPTIGGWTVEADHALEPVVFYAGGRAEAYARSVATALSQSGRHAYVIVNDSGGRMVGKRFYVASGVVSRPGSIYDPRAA